MAAMAAAESRVEAALHAAAESATAAATGSNKPGLCFAVLHRQCVSLSFPV